MDDSKIKCEIVPHAKSSDSKSVSGGYTHPRW